jgi:hypothetical protein
MHSGKGKWKEKLEFRQAPLLFEVMKYCWSELRTAMEMIS